MTDFSLPLSDGAVLRGYCEGSGPDMLLVSGLGGTAEFWSAASKLLATRFRVIRFDQRGTGASTRGDAVCDISQLATDARAVLDHLECHETILVGHSTGGCIVQEMALAEQKAFPCIVLSGTWAGPNRYMSKLFNVRKTLLRLSPDDYAALGALSAYPPDWLHRNWHVFEKAMSQAPMCENNKQIIGERITALLAFDRTTDLQSINLPSFIIGARDDTIVPLFLQQQLSARIPRSTIDMMDSGGHFFPVSRAEDFVKLLAGRVTQVRPVNP